MDMIINVIIVFLTLGIIFAAMFYALYHGWIKLKAFYHWLVGEIKNIDSIKVNVVKTGESDDSQDK